MPSDVLVALEDIVHGFGRSTEEWTYKLPLVLHPAMNILEAKPTRTLDTSSSAPTDGAGRLAKRTGHWVVIPLEEALGCFERTEEWADDSNNYDVGLPLVNVLETDDCSTT